MPSLNPALGHQPDITLADALDEPDARLDALRMDQTTTYLAYLPHSGLHNQRIALENALTLARLLNRTLLVPPARLGPKTLPYVHSSELAQMLRLSDKRQNRLHCAYIPPDLPQPDECVDYATYTFVPWAWLVDLGPGLVRTPNATAEWIEERLGVHPNETRFMFDTEPYEYQFVDTLAPARVGAKYLHMIPIDALASAPERLIQLGTLFGSSRLRLRRAENQRVRGEVRRRMVFGNGNPALTGAARMIGEALGGAYLAAHVRIGDGRFQQAAREIVRDIWWKLVRDVGELDTQTAMGLEKRMMNGVDADDEPPEMPSDMVGLHSLSALSEVFLPQLSCRNRLHTAPELRRFNMPLFIATDAPSGLNNPLLAPLVHTFPCTFVLGSFTTETMHLRGLRNGYDGLLLAGFLEPILDALVMGGAWAVVGTEGSTFSRYVVDVLWRVSHGWEIKQRG